MSDSTEPRAIDVAVSIVEGTAEEAYIGMTKVVSVRIPLLYVVQAQAMAHKCGQTRNGMIVSLLKVGLEEVRSRLSDETRETVSRIESELIGDELQAIEEGQ